MLYVVKKDGTRENFNVEKIVNAVNKSAARILYKFSRAEIQFICESVSYTHLTLPTTLGV